MNYSAKGLVLNMALKEENKVIPLDEYDPNKKYDKGTVFEWGEEPSFDTDIIRILEDEGIDVSNIKKVKKND